MYADPPILFTWRLLPLLIPYAVNEAIARTSAEIQPATSLTKAICTVQDTPTRMKVPKYRRNKAAILQRQSWLISKVIPETSNKMTAARDKPVSSKPANTESPHPLWVKNARIKMTNNKVHSMPP